MIGGNMGHLLMVDFASEAEKIIDLKVLESIGGSSLCIEINPHNGYYESAEKYITNYVLGSDAEEEEHKELKQYLAKCKKEN